MLQRVLCLSGSAGRLDQRLGARAEYREPGAADFPPPAFCREGPNAPITQVKLFCR